MSASDWAWAVDRDAKSDKAKNEAIRYVFIGFCTWFYGELIIGFTV